MLAAPSSVASSASAGRDRRSHSCEVEGSTEDRSRSRSSRPSPSRGLDSCGECHCARSQSGEGGGRVTGLTCHTLAPRPV